MRKYFLIATLGISALFIGCENSSSRNAPRKSDTPLKKRIDYSDKVVLDSLIKSTPHSSEKMFLGFTIGMTKNDYKNHIAQLKKEGKTLSYSGSNQISSAVGTFDLGSGYTFKTDITSDVGGKKLTGKGEYFLEPGYNQEGKLMTLNIVPFEKWSGEYGGSKNRWFKKNILKNSSPFVNDDLKKVLTENAYIDNYTYVRQKKNLIIYESTFKIKYTDLKTLLTELLMKQMKEKAAEEDIKDIQF